MKVWELESSCLYISRHGYVYKLIDGKLFWTRKDNLDEWKESRLQYNEIASMEFSEYPVDIEPTNDDIGKAVFVRDDDGEQWREMVFLAKYKDMFYVISKCDEFTATAWKYAKLF